MCQHRSDVMRFSTGMNSTAPHRILTQARASAHNVVDLIECKYFLILKRANLFGVRAYVCVYTIHIFWLHILADFLCVLRTY